MKTTLLVISLFIMSSCANFELFNKETDIYNISKGQELLDLKEALDSGAISEQEYQKLKSKIIDDQLDK